MIKNILLFYPNNPFSRRHGVHSRFLQLMKYWKSRGFIVDMLSHKNKFEGWEDDIPIPEEAFTLIDSLELNDFKKSKKKALKLSAKLKNRITGAPPKFLLDYAYPDLRVQFREILARKKYDYIIISFVEWANLLEELNYSATTILTVEDFMTLNYFDKNKGDIDVGANLSEEIKRVNFFDKVICISRDEKKFFERFCRKPQFYYIPHSMPVRNLDLQKDKEFDILYVGSNNPFNKDGIFWFFKNILPRLDVNLKITIIGNVNDYLDKFKSLNRNIEFIEYAPTLDEYYLNSKISICPMLGGTGLKIKVVESLSFGVPVVSTLFGLTGIEYYENNGCLCTDEPEEFAGAINALLSDETLRLKKAEEAFLFFRNNFAEERIFEELDKVFI